MRKCRSGWRPQESSAGSRPSADEAYAIRELTELEADELVRRTDQEEAPPRVDYSLTPLGRSLAQVLAPLCEWGVENMAEVSRVFAQREGWSGRRG